MSHLCRIHNIMVNVCIHDECQPNERAEKAEARVAVLEAEITRLDRLHDETIRADHAEERFAELKEAA